MNQNKSENSKQEDTKDTAEVKNIHTVVKDKIKSMGNLRGSRIEASKRLENYSRKWNFILFFLNVEAIIIVLLSLTNTIETIYIGPINMSFTLLSGIFTLYVILLQYYVNILNYNERALRLSYHQLEVEDLIQQLNLLKLKANLPETDIREKEVIEKYDDIVNKYQLVIKNNENHRDLDYKRLKYDQAKRLHEKGKAKEAPTGKRSKDFTLDMALIYANTILAILMFGIVFYALAT